MTVFAKKAPRKEAWKEMSQNDGYQKKELQDFIMKLVMLCYLVLFFVTKSRNMSMLTNLSCKCFAILKEIIKWRRVSAIRDFPLHQHSF